AEWEKAARGAEGRMYPWGDAFDPDACRWNREDRGDRFLDTAPVTAHPRGASPYGVMDMVGNLAEWCADGPGPHARYLKGGSFINASPLHLRPADRSLSGWANNPMAFYGSRCAEDAG
ncbi:MAG: SUMF1/EgtB/PvdO family nonheme iron enzyme, partial [Armatimonadetes bacterium]|nr:SUMF1/EgtB/PvdO family nonheme iron enzyme [Armatimonadota bacterium]